MRKLRSVVFIIIVSLIPLLWFKKGHLIAGGDVAAFIDLGNYLKFLPYTWDEQLLIGRHNFQPHFLLPYGLFWGCFEKCGVPANIVEQLWACTTFFFSGLSMYYLLSIILPEKDAAPARLLGALFYMINPHVANTPLLVQYNLAPIYMFTPLVMGLYMQGIACTHFRTRFRYASLFGLSSLLFASSSLNITHLFVLICTLGIYTAYYLATRRGGIGAASQFIALCAALYFLLNFWWISTAFVKMVNLSGNVAKAQGAWEVLNATSLADGFRLIGSWAWRAGHRDNPYFPHYLVYDSALFLSIEFLLLFVIFSAILVAPRASIFPAILAIAGLFMIKGSNGAFGFLYKIAWKHVPGFWIFREPFAKFIPMVIFAYAILLPVSVHYFLKQIRNLIVQHTEAIRNKAYEPFIRTLPATLPIVIGACILTLGFPSLTGQSIWDQYNGETRSLHVKIPDYWHDASGWFRANDPDALVFPLPKTGYGRSPYNWESGYNAECSPVKNLFPTPLIYYEDFPHTPFQRWVSDTFNMYQKGATAELPSETIRLIGVKYILHQRDVDWRFTWPKALSHDELRSKFQHDAGLRLFRTFGKLDVYQIMDPLPTIYAANRVTVEPVTVNPSDMDAHMTARAPLLFLDFQLNPFDKAAMAGSFAEPGDTATAPGLTERQPLINFEKINPTKYVVHASSDKPFWLILNQTFCSEWTAFLAPAETTPSSAVQKRVFLDEFLNGKRWTPLKRHYAINGFANGWWVDKKGPATIIVQYGPQYRFELWIYIAMITAILLITYNALCILKRTHKGAV